LIREIEEQFGIIKTNAEGGDATAQQDCYGLSKFSHVCP